MPSIRSFEARDIGTAAGLFQRQLRKLDAPANADLKSYLGTLFLDDESLRTGLTSRVHGRDDGTVADADIVPANLGTIERVAGFNAPKQTA